MRGGDEPARWARLVSGGDGDAGERVCGLSVWLAGPAGSGCSARGGGGRRSRERAERGLGPRGEERGGELGRPGEREREEEADRAGLTWAGFWVLASFPFSKTSFLLFLIQTSLNSNANLNSNHTQLKVCTSMNAQQNLNL